MKKTLKLETNCGEKTCYSEPGAPCQFLRTRKFGTVYFCNIWHDLDSHLKPLNLEENIDGWLLRRPECLLAEKGLKINERTTDNIK